jgi:hypothetical protein
MIVLSVIIGVLFGLAIAAILNRTPSKPNVTPGISVIGCDMSGRGPAEIDRRYSQMIADVLQQPATERGFRNLLP